MFWEMDAVPVTAIGSVQSLSFSQLSTEMMIDEILAAGTQVIGIVLNQLRCEQTH
jgi:hypothetical protein